MALLGEPYAGLIRAAAARTGTDPTLCLAIGAAEGSNGDPAARSSAGAVGVMQLMPETARGLGLVVDGDRDDRLDPALNIDAGVRMLHWLSTVFPGRLDLIAAGYNAGAGAVHAAGDQVPPFGETRAYVANVTAYYQQIGGGGSPIAEGSADQLVAGDARGLLPLVLVAVGVVVIAGVIA